MKRAEVTGPSQPLALVTCDIPEPPADGCLVKTTYAGICHTDVHVISSKLDMGGGQYAMIPDILKARGYKFEGLVPGHEIIGTIESFGKNVDPSKHSLKIGDKVLVFPWIGCGDCDVCESGYSNICENNHELTTDIGMGNNPGGYSTHVPVPRIDYAVKVPDCIPDNIGCMLPCSGVTTYWAVLKSNPYIEHALTKFGKARLMCVGAGGLGLWAIQLAKAIYKDKKVTVVATDICKDHLDLAKTHGADEVILWNREDSDETTAAKTTENGTKKIDAAIDLVGRGSTSNISQLCLHKAGTLIAVGLAGGALTMPMPRLVLGCYILQGTITGPLSVLQDLVKFVETHKIGYPSQEVYSLDQVNEAVDKLRDGKVKGRAVIKF